MRRYSKEFKEEALKLSDEIGVKKTSEQLGIQYYTISCWRRNHKKGIIKT
jgi:transposase